MATMEWVDGATDGLRAIAAEHGSFLRREALAVGIDDRTLRDLLRSGQVVRVRHGAYAFRDVWDELDLAGRHLLRARAALRVLAPRVVASHHSSCLLHGLPLWGADLGTLHVTRADGGAGRLEGDVQHHEGFLASDDVVEGDGVRATRPVRAVLESASLMTVEKGLAVVDAGLHDGLFDLDALAEQGRTMQSWPGARGLQLVIRLGDPKSESVGESRVRYLLWSRGFPAPVSQYEVVAAGELLGRCDFAWPDHGVILEFDGKEKYLKYLRPGESPADAVVREKRREDRIRLATGWRVIRLTWADLERPARTVAMIRAVLGI